MYYVGIDIAQQHHDALVMDQDGEVVIAAFRFANTRQGLDILHQRLQPLKAPIRIGMEATGHYWLALHEALLALNYTVAVFNPLQIKAYRQSGLRKTKTDPVDCFWIADFLRIGRGQPVAVIPPSIRQMRETARLRFALLQKQTDIQRRTLTILDRVFPEYRSFFSRPFSVTSQALLRQAVTAQTFAQWPVEEMAQSMHRASRGHLGLKHAQALHELATVSLGVRSLEPVAPLHMRLLLDQIALFADQIKLLDQELAQLLEQTECHLTSIPGISTTLAATILGEIGDIQRFSHLKQLVAFAGLDPTTYQSGQFQASHRRLSKRGSLYLRRALWLAANIARQHDPDLRALYLRKRQQRKHHNVAIAAVAHRLLARIYVILKERRPYRINTEN
jgi:transposase